MPPIDPQIILGIRTPQFQDPLESYGKSLALKGLMGQQELQSLQTQQARQGIEDDTATRAAYAESGGDNTRLRALLAGRGQHKAVNALDKLLFEQKKDQSTIDVNNARASELRGQEVTRALGNYRSALSRVNSPQAAAEWIRAQYADPLLKSVVGGVPVEQAIAEIPTDPAAFQQWRAQEAMGMAEFLKANADKHIQRPRGDVTETLAIPGLGGAPRVIASAPMGHAPEAPSVVANRPFNPDGTPNPAYQKYEKDKAAAGASKVNVEVKERQRTFENEDKLRADYAANPAVKSSSEMQNAFNLIDQAYKRPSAANDLAMATKYMKILDPTSVVRESEFAMAVNATGLFDKVMNYSDAILKGQRLNPTQRKDFYDSAKAINDAFQSERAKVDQQFSELTTGYGLNPQNVIPALRTRAVPKPAVPASPAAPALDFDAINAELQRRRGQK